MPYMVRVTPVVLALLGLYPSTTQLVGTGETSPCLKPMRSTMGISAKTQPQSKLTRLKLPLVPEEVTRMAMGHHSGMENTAWRLKKRVGSTGTWAKSASVRTCSGENPCASATARYSGQRFMCQAVMSRTARRKAPSEAGGSYSLLSQNRR